MNIAGAAFRVDLTDAANFFGVSPIIVEDRDGDDQHRPADAP
jgi:hypothetical protein